MKTGLPIAFAVCASLASPALAQSTPDVCKSSMAEVSAEFRAETDLKDLITWAMAFTQRNFLLDPRSVAIGVKLTIVAPSKLSCDDAYALFLAALSTMDRDVVPQGNLLRIVEPAAAVWKQSIPAVYRRNRCAKPQHVVLTARKPDPSLPMTFETSIR